VPPDGRPIVLGPDAPVTGGYPVIAVLAHGELDRLAQLRPGAEVRFSR
jgi:allophanate hydrolase subunit 2